MSSSDNAASRFPLLRVVLANATLLSSIYLGAAALIEAVRRWLSPRWSEAASHAMEKLPARALEWTGLMERLRHEYIHGRLNEFSLRVVFGVTTVLIIFAMAFLVGAVMWVIRELWERQVTGR